MQARNEHKTSPMATMARKTGTTALQKAVNMAKAATIRAAKPFLACCGGAQSPAPKKAPAAPVCGGELLVRAGWDKAHFVAPEVALHAPLAELAAACAAAPPSVATSVVIEDAPPSLPASLVPRALLPPPHTLALLPPPIRLALPAPPTPRVVADKPPAAPCLPPLPLLTWEDVQIVQHMFARGGNGAVHRANVRGMPVVIKTILPGTEGVAAAVASQALHREAAVTGRVRQTFGPGGHPHILGVVGVVKPCPGVGLGIVLPLMEGGNAWDFWCRWAVPAQSQLYKLLCAVELAGSAACGVAGLHCAGLAHRDVKGENLLLHPPTRSFGGLPVPGVGVMADFGSCREAGTVPGHLAGTQGYVAPELVLAAEQGVGVVTGLSDVWGIGCMLVNFLTGINVGTNLVFTPTAEIEELLAQVLLGACGVEGIQVADTIFNCVKGCLCEDPSQWWSASVLAMRQVLVCTSLCLLSVAWRLCCVVTVDC